MSEEKNEKPNGLSETDKGYYDALYDDLPKEVVDILMQTHPLMGKNEDAESTAYRTRRPRRREDLEEVREARMQQVGSEIDEAKNAPGEEGEPTKYVSRHARRETVAEEDDIQYVSMLPARKRSRITEEITIQTAAPQKHGKKAKKEAPFATERPRYEDMDFEEKVKREHLDSLYDDEDYDEDYGRGIGKLPVILGIIALVLIIFLIFRTVSLSSQLESVQNELTQSQDYKQKYEDIQLEKMQLEEKLTALEGSAEDTETKTEDDEKTQKADETKTETSTAASTNSSGTKQYTVKEGDTMWTIAQSQLGNGAEYQKILDANGLKESDTLKPGTVIKIPK